jgi:hypothetical protein
MNSEASQSKAGARPEEKSDQTKESPATVSVVFAQEWNKYIATRFTSEEQVCPICQEPVFGDAFSSTNVQFPCCGKLMHLKPCSEQYPKQTCPFCRQNFVH